MAGNALDRVKAKNNIIKAENGIEEVCSRLQEVSENVRELSNSYTGKNEESAITKVYREYQKIITQCMEAFGGTSEIFLNYHKGLVALINQGADGDEINPSISRHSKLTKGLVIGSITPGIKDYAVTKKCVETLQVSVDKFVTATDEIIAAYQSIWWIADEVGNVAIQEKAHSAAEKVRELIRTYATKFKLINENFRDSIEKNEAQQNLSATELETRAEELYKILESVDFNTISMEQDAVNLIATSWRKYL